MDASGSINNVPEVLQTALQRPVTVIEGERQIACIVSVAYFAEIGGDPEQLVVRRRRIVPSSSLPAASYRGPQHPAGGYLLSASDH